MDVLDIVAILILVAELIIFYYLRKNRHFLTRRVKLLTLSGIIVIPILSVIFANYHVFVGTKESQSCVACHMMAPMGNDMIDPESSTLAARHFQNGYIRKDACYACHKDYGFQGQVKAKLDGYRHLMRYITDTYEEPILYRGEFNDNNCLSCHEGTYTFHAVDEHKPVLEIKMTTGSISCLNCHGRAHPEPNRRTPGHPDYEMLSATPEEITRLKALIEDLESYEANLEEE
jgi:nitrate/TMAO reductase-like tetraheme cytochrome c subunit